MTSNVLWQDLSLHSCVPAYDFPLYVPWFLEWEEFCTHNRHKDAKLAFPVVSKKNEMFMQWKSHVVGMKCMVFFLSLFVISIPHPCSFSFFESSESKDDDASSSPSLLLFNLLLLLLLLLLCHPPSWHILLAYFDSLPF